MKPASVLAALLLSLIAIGHILRLVFRVPVTIDGVAIPLWVSIPGFVVPAALAFLIFRERRAEKPNEAS